VIAVDALKAALLLFVVAVVQVSLLSSVDVVGGMPNLLLVTIVSVALLRGSVFGAAGGFFGGLLFDTANLETLGLTSLILTIGGYWIGRYGETTGRDRTHAPFVSVAVVTVLYAVGVVVLHFLIGDPVSGRRILLESLFPTIAFNLLLTAPV
jgi:rod shape-determining protein MreD